MSGNDGKTIMIMNDDTLLDDGEVMRKIRLYDERLTAFDPMVAYLRGDYYYLYRGSLQNKGPNPDEPGIYWDELGNRPVLFDPVTPEDKAKYSHGDKIHNNAAAEIIKAINDKKVEVYVFPESNRVFCPEITASDDILKRLMKMLILSKGIDLDRIKYRFVDKNALFNFKQVIKGDNRLSMLLFERGIDAMNLKYTITVTEADGETIGVKLQNPITASSSDTYVLGAGDKPVSDATSA